VQLLRNLARAYWRARYRERWRRLAFPDVVRRFGSPERINRYMQACFDYVSDDDLHAREEVWQAPALTHELMRGDCEDFALFAWFALRAHGFDAFLVAVFTPDRGHAVCAFRGRGGYHTICNEGLKLLAVPGRPHADPLLPHPNVARRIADHVFPGDWECCAFVDGLRLRTSRDSSREFDPGYEWIYPEGT
jgi:hypothetical protein